MSNITTIHCDPENRAKDALNLIVLKANIFLIENSFSMLQANIFLIESSLSNVTTIYRDYPKNRGKDASARMLRPALVSRVRGIKGKGSQGSGVSSDIGLKGQGSQGSGVSRVRGLKG